MLVSGFWLLAAGCRSLASGHWLLVAGRCYRLMVVDHLISMEYYELQESRDLARSTTNCN